MAKRVQLIRHTTAAADAFVGKDGEVTVDTSKRTLRVHDNATPGGFETALANLSNSQAATASTDGKMTSTQANLLTGSAGVAEANKALILGGTKNVDTIDVANAGLKLGGVAVTATASELNALDLATGAGTAEANKAVVLDGSKNVGTINQLTTTNLTLGGVAVSLTSSDDKLDNFPAGTAMLFYQASAPTGWTEAGSLADHALRAVTVASTDGGSTGGTVNFSTVFARTATDGHTLSITEIPSHNHGGGDHTHVLSAGPGPDLSTPQRAKNATATSTSNLTTNSSGVIIATQGGGGGHTHDIDLQVKYANVIVASKN